MPPVAFPPEPPVVMPPPKPLPPLPLPPVAAPPVPLPPVPPGVPPLPLASAPPVPAPPVPEAPPLAAPPPPDPEMPVSEAVSLLNAPSLVRAVLTDLPHPFAAISAEPNRPNRTMRALVVKLFIQETVRLLIARRYQGTCKPSETSHSSAIRRDLLGGRDDCPFLLGRYPRPRGAHEHRRAQAQLHAPVPGRPQPQIIACRPGRVDAASRTPTGRGSESRALEQLRLGFRGTGEARNLTRFPPLGAPLLSSVRTSAGRATRKTATNACSVGDRRAFADVTISFRS